MKETIAWVADEYKQHERDTGWYAGLFLMGAVLILWSLYTRNVISAILFGLIVFMAYFLSRREPAMVRVMLSTEGAQVDEIFYPYNNIDHFWIAYKPPHVAQLHLHTKATFNKVLTVELEDQDPQEVHDYLSRFIPEHEEGEERFVDVLMRSLKL